MGDATILCCDGLTGWWRLAAIPPLRAVECFWWGAQTAISNRAFGESVMRCVICRAGMRCSHGMIQMQMHAYAGREPMESTRQLSGCLALRPFVCAVCVRPPSTPLGLPLTFHHQTPSPALQQHIQASRCHLILPTIIARPSPPTSDLCCSHQPRPGHHHGARYLLPQQDRGHEA
jgi:hypothetical protein